MKKELHHWQAELSYQALKKDRIYLRFSTTAFSMSINYWHFLGKNKKQTNKQKQNQTNLNNPANQYFKSVDRRNLEEPGLDGILLMQISHSSS